MRASLNTSHKRLADLAAGFARHRQVSRVHGWVRAWLDELRGLLPAPVRRRLFEGAAIRRIDWPLPAGVEPGSAILVLPGGEIMAQTLSLPAAATADLHRVMAFEIDRYTPFSADQVHFTARVVERTAERVLVQLSAVERRRLMDMIEHCQKQGLALHAIDALDANGEAMAIDLLPSHLRPAPSSAVRTQRVLLLTCAVLTVTAMSTLLDRRQALVEHMTREVAEQRQQMAALEASRRELTDTQGASGYLARLKTARPTLTVLLTELSHCLGDDSWLEQLEVRDSGDINLSGQSRQASALINQVRNCRSLQNPRFQGVIQPDPQSGRDRFSLTAQLRQEATDASTPQP